MNVHVYSREDDFVVYRSGFLGKKGRGASYSAQQCVGQWQTLTYGMLETAQIENNCVKVCEHSRKTTYTEIGMHGALYEELVYNNSDP